MQTYINPPKQNNDHIRIKRKVRFRSSFKKVYFKEKPPKVKDVKDFWNFCKPYFTNDETIVLSSFVTMKK